jgi:ribose transport system substrate-binding protein
MTVQAEIPSTKPSRRRSTPFLLVLILILIGLLLWSLGVFRHQTHVAIITSGDGPYWDPVEAGANKAADLYDVKVSVIRCKTDMLLQIEKIKDALGEHYDAIAISPINPTSESTALADVAATTNLVTMDSDSPVARRTCFVGTDNYDAGRLCGQVVRGAVNGGGEVILFLGNPEKENTQRRRQGVIDELLQRSFDPERADDPLDAQLKGGDFSVVGTIVDNADPNSTTQLATQAIKDHPNVKCFVGLLSYSAPALVKAVDQAGKADQIKVVGFDVSSDTLDGVESGKIAGTIMQDQFGCGYQTVHVLADVARGNTAELPVFGKKTLPCMIVKKDNVAQARAQLTGGSSSASTSGDGGGGGGGTGSAAPSTTPG